MGNDWTLQPLENVAFIEMGQSPLGRFVNEDPGQGVAFLQGNADFTDRFPRPRLWCSRPAKIALGGDTLISVRAPVGALNRADQEYCIGRGLAAVRFTGMNPDFGFHALAKYSQALHQVAQGTTFEAVGSRELRALIIPCCSENEQRRIAEILDTADEAIERTEHVVAKLKAIRRGLLRAVLTRGIDEKPSSQETEIGAIPEGWKVASLSDISTVITSGSRGWARYYSPDGAIFVRIGNLTRGHLDLRLDDVVYVRPPSAGEGSRTALREGDLLISITADLGIIGVVPADFGEAYVNQHVALVRLRTECVNPRWIGSFLAGIDGQRQFMRLNDAGAKAGLNLPSIGGLLVPLPPFDEQERIAAIIAAHDERIGTEERYLAKLRRLKAGLATDLLTGRVRVRGVDEKAAA